jgi:hypothetical protein
VPALAERSRFGARSEPRHALPFTGYSLPRRATVIGVTSQSVRNPSFDRRPPGISGGTTFGLLCSFIAQQIEIIINTSAQKLAAPRKPLRFLEWMLAFRLNETFGLDGASATTGRTVRAEPLETFPPTTWGASWARGVFFIFFRRNPLKSPASTKGIQRNARTFPCSYLEFLARNSRIGCTEAPPCLNAPPAPSFTFRRLIASGTAASERSISTQNTST